MFASASPLVRCLAAFVVCSVSFSGWAQTFKETKRLADIGSVDAQYNLALMYYNGEGVPQDHKEAIKWFRKAAEQGDADAQRYIGVLYKDGDKGLIQDYIRAHVWFNIAAANGDEEGRKLRDTLAKEMTSDQLAEAQKMASEMVEAIPKLMGD